MQTVEEIKKLLLSRKSTRKRFELNISVEETTNYLEAAIQCEIEARGGSYHRSDLTDEYIKRTARWFACGSKYGIMFCGTCGNGKSTFARAIRTLFNLWDMKDYHGQGTAMGMFSARDIADFNANDKKKYASVRNSYALVIDDLGLEPVEVLSYGNVLNPVIDIITYRYDELLPTVITTNLTSKEVRERYGDRIADRFNEMLEVVPFVNSTYRGKK